jgi:hypothetical protein
VRVQRARISIPVVGPWWASIELVSGPAPTGRQTLSLGGVDWVGTVERAGERLGDATVIMRAGGGGWGSTLPARAYQDPGLIRLSTVLSDAASAAGEELASGYAEEELEEHYARPAGPAASVLDGRPWNVRADGQTAIGERAGGAVPTGYDVSRYRPDGGAIELKVESLGGLEPGCTVEVLGVGTVTLGALDIELGDDLVVRSRARRPEASSDSPIRDAFAALVRKAVREAIGIPQLCEYRIALLNGDRLDLVPADATRGLPVLRAVPLMPGIPGASAEPALGGRVLVAFADGRASRPRVVAFTGVDGEAFTPDTLAFDANSIELGAAAGAVVREGDTISLTDGSTGVVVIENDPMVFPKSKVSA